MRRVNAAGPAHYTQTVSDLVLERVGNRADYEAATARATHRIAYENLLQEGYAQVERWLLPAVCQACGTAVGLLADKEHGAGGRVNFRERLICPVCGLNTRQRLMAHLLRDTVATRPHTPRTYLYEQVTPFFHWAARTLPGEVIGSEYLGYEFASGAVVDGIRHEDALALSFEDASLDVIVSQDVLEHVPAIDPAVAEAARVLRSGGRLLFSVPFDPSADVTVQRATMRDGQVVNLLEPQFHGNPVSAEGSLVFYDHGWDLLDGLRGAGFVDVHIVGAWSALYGYLSGGLVTVFSATRR